MVSIPIIIFGIIRYRRTDICICRETEVEEISNIKPKLYSQPDEIKVESSKTPVKIVVSKKQFNFQEKDLDNKIMKRVNSNENKSVFKTPQKSKDDDKIPSIEEENLHLERQINLRNIEKKVEYNEAYQQLKVIGNKQFESFLQNSAVHNSFDKHESRVSQDEPKLDKKLSVTSNRKVETSDIILSKEESYKCLSPGVIKYIEQIQQYRQSNVSENKNQDSENKNSQNKDNENKNNLKKIELIDQIEKSEDYQYEDEPHRKSMLSRFKNFLWSSDMNTESKKESENKTDNMMLSHDSENTKTTRSSNNYQNTKKEPE